MIERVTLQRYSPPRYLETGWQLGYEADGMGHSRLVGNGEEMMAKIEEITRSKQLDGFTLFMHQGKGWQMSVRRHGESGWSVQIITDEQAQAVLSMLEASGHPDGPMQVRQIEPGADCLLKVLARWESALGAWRAAIEAQ